MQQNMREEAVARSGKQRQILTIKYPNQRKATFCKTDDYFSFQAKTLEKSRVS